MELTEARGALTGEDSARGSAKGATNVRSERIRIEQHSGAGLLWFAGWLFSIGFLHLTFWKGVLALVIWPYYLGTAVAAALAR